jgi:uncharacterized protein (TIGR03435 family)
MKVRTLLGLALVVGVTTGAEVRALQPPPPAPLPAFDVASIKSANRDTLQRRGLACGFAPGRFSGLGDLRWFVACAHGIPAARSRQDIAGLPKWADEELFEIHAIFPVSDQARSVSPAERLAMIRTLLADRFKLAVHRERKVVPSYALVIARKDGTLGPQLQPTPKACADWLAAGRQNAPPNVFGDLPCGRGMVTGFVIRQTRMPLSQLANLLSPRVERLVEDRTGLTGTYAFDLQWAAEPMPLGPASSGVPSTSPPDNLPTSIFTALQEQLGLRLEPSKTTADLLVVDHVERPTPND